jgi:hypothetical protein
MQRYTLIVITINVLHVSGGFSAHHQELNTVYTLSGICRAFTASYRLREHAVRSTHARSHERKKKDMSTVKIWYTESRKLPKGLN